MISGDIDHLAAWFDGVKEKGILDCLLLDEINVTQIEVFE